MAVQTNPEGVIIRGKAGGTVYQQWHGMQVRRSRKIPTNPRSERQLDVRADLVEIVAGIKTSFAVDGIKQMWADWAALNPFPTTRRGNNVTLPAYSAALKVGVATYQFDLYSPASAIPTTSPPQNVPAVTITAVDNTLKIASLGSGAPYADTKMQLWVCGPLQSGAPHAVSAKPQMAKLVYIQDNLDAAIVAHVFYTAVLDFGAQADYCVWARVMRPTDAVPGTWEFLGNYTLTGA